MCASHDSHACECCAESCSAAPFGPRNTIGIVELAARHVEHLGGGVDDLVEREQREVPRHELDDRAQADHRRADADAGEAELGDRRVDDAHLAEFLEQALGDLVRALVDADFLAHEEDAVVALHLFAQRLVERVAVGDDWHRVSAWHRDGCAGSSRSSCRRARPRTAPRAAARGSGRRSPRRPARRPSSRRRACASSSSVELAVVLHVHAQQRDRVALHVLLELRLRAVRAAHRVGHRVAHEAVRAHLEQRRAADSVRARSTRLAASPRARRTRPGRRTIARGMSYDAPRS